MMINLIHLDIDQIRHNGDEVALIRLNGEVIYEGIYSCEYTVDPNSSNTFEYYGTIGAFIGTGGASLKYELTLTDGTKTSSLYHPCSAVSKVKVWYPLAVNKITFEERIYTVDKLNTSRLRTMQSMFFNCTSLKTVNSSDWDTSKVTNMYCTFYGCEDLESIDMTNWDVSKITSFSGTFQNCYKLISVGDIKNLNVLSLVSPQNMFENCYSLKSMDLSNWNVIRVDDVTSMFDGCSNLEKVDLRNWHFNKDIIADPYGMVSYDIFRGCYALHELRLDYCDYDTIKTIIQSDNFPTNAISGGRFIYCQESNIGDLEPPQNWTFVFVEEPEVVPEPEVPYYKPYEFREDTTITTVTTTVDNEHHTNLSYMFDGCINLTTVNTQDWDTSNVTNMYSMFYKCNSLTSLDVSKWDTSNVTNMAWMFGNCKSLTSLDVSNFDTSNVTSMQYMFGNCESLTSLDVSKWDTRNVTNMKAMFYNCESLTSLDLSNWDISKVTSLTNAFNNCPSLVDFRAPKNIDTSIDVNNSTALSRDSLLSIINNLKATSRTKYLILGATNLAKLGSYEIAIATNKGWIVE